MKEKGKALIAMSGGVDSSVAAYLTLQSGKPCLGVTMLLYDNTDAGLSRGRTCCSLADINDAYAAALRLGIPFHVHNLQREFRKLVMNPFAEGYLRGKTPNPCVECNRYIKFGALHEHAYELGCDIVVTGHYARIENRNGQWLLRKALDEKKDQSYVLYHLTQETLAHMSFPLGEMRKEETRRIAEKLGFANARKRDSQDICFAPDGDYAAAVERLSGIHCPPGNYVDRKGNILGRHRGIIHYTVGQRRGLGLSGEDRRYVLSVHPEDGTVVLGENQALYRRELTATDFHWIAGEPPRTGIPVLAKIRYRHQESPAIAEPLRDGSVRIIFDEAQRAITPGQSVVLYDGDIVLGGGMIASADGLM